MTVQSQLRRESAGQVWDGGAAGELPLTVIEPRSGWVPLELDELWRYRELLYFLTWRDIKVRYKQTLFGGTWAIMQPLLAMFVFTLFFGRVADLPSNGLPYPLFAYSALVVWTYFANSISQASNSLVNQERLITKIYFPRVLIPIASVSAGLVDLLFALAALVCLQVYYGVKPGLAIVLLPLFIALASLTAFGVGLWLSALNVQYRDVRFTVPFFVQLWLVATPIAYPSSLVPEQWRPLYGLNPMAGVVEGFRWAILGHGDPPSALLAVSVLVVFLVVIGGMYYFRRMEQQFVDVV